jgi:3-oxoacyl-[acyl-carrier-protein] synthase II
MQEAKIRGFGWVKKNTYNLGVQGKGLKYSDLRALYNQLKAEGVFKFPVENFGRFDRSSKLVMIATALALHNAGFNYVKGCPQEMGILGTSPLGSTETNLDYFKDYVQAGRTMARGNLFIYTLASSPLAEAAIYFGLGGPSLFLGYSKDATKKMLKHAQLMLENKETESVLAVEFNSNEAKAYLIR